MSQVFTSCLLLVLPTVALAQEAVFEREGWMGEGIPVLIAANDEIRLNSGPDLRTSERAIAYRAGWLIPYDVTLVRTLEARELVTEKAGPVELYCEGSGVEQVELAAGETWTYLQYRAEGHVMARIRDRVCEVPALMNEEVFGINLPEPVVQWWVQVLYADGSSPGWLLVSDDQVAFGDRRF